MLRRLLLPTCLLLLLATTPLADTDLIGFTPESAREQRALESEFDASLDHANLDRWMRRLTENPQHVGSPQGRASAEFVRDLFRDWGYDADIVQYDVLFPTPVERLVQLVHPDTFSLNLDEPVIEEDSYSSNRENMLPPYNAYSADGDVTAELVYVNYGIPDDYEELERLGISVEGKIVIARYGGSWRGIKPKVAAEHGAVGCILYSDPRDDGYWRGDVYPEGPFKMGMGAQRGSVSDMPLYPGDPLTPGRGATPEAERLSREEAPTIMDIPVLPISYDNALPLLEAMEGPVAPDHWKGALPITYHVGPGPARVHLKLSFSWDLVPAYNVIARLEGDTWPDEWVIRGNHRDAWVFGAADPTSGHVAMLEEARVVGMLAEAGNRPDRTIIYASWDAEEPGLLGSTEWAEHHAAELDEHAVAYINTDGYGRGFLHMGGSHALQPFMNEIGRDVPDPQTSVSVLERARARQMVREGTAGNNDSDGGDDLGAGDNLPLSPLGSGSDYTPFLQHLGIASLNLGFGGENAGGSYHSAYDSYDHFVRFGDPGFEYGIALARVAGRATLRLANADILPFKFEPLADRVATYLNEVQELAKAERTSTKRHNTLVEYDAFDLAADPTKPYNPPEAKEPVPYLNFTPALNAARPLEEQSAAADRTIDRALQRGSATGQGLSRGDAETLNAILYKSERSLTSEEGLPRRPWFRHLVYAPGFYTGYGVKTLPGIREAIEQRSWDEADHEIQRAADMMRRLDAVMRRAAESASAHSGG